MELEDIASLVSLDTTKADSSPLTIDDLSLPTTPLTDVDTPQTMCAITTHQEVSIVLEAQMYARFIPFIVFGGLTRMIIAAPMSSNK